MKPFNIEISSISKGPKELSYQLPIEAKVLKQIPGKDRDDYFIAELENNVFWVDKDKGINQEISHLVIASKYKEETISSSMKNMTIAVAYVLDQAVLKEPTLDFRKCKYIAVGSVSAKGRWQIFG